ncbi:MAG: NADH-quinone oxidoreductase subunit J [Verrucomicrobiota bacterium]|nr:NADH-quinone oxidoreductase subunit J [Verrucomicrobiota bacterium]
MLDILFYILSAFTLIAALLMVMSPNAVNGAMCMIAAFVGTAALFILLEAYFLAILQVLVYAGAVMVLFLFIIMLLNVEEIELSKRKSMRSNLLAVLSFIIVSGLVIFAFSGDYLPEPELLPVAANPDGSLVSKIPFTTSSKSFGYSLFSKYMLPFQVTGFLLLSGMIGVIVISKKSSEQLEAEALLKKERDAS